ncbi:PRELI domain-containing protein 1, mitochondrial-like [Acanthaster planci]|uniref:PRELI domain-containing protein 1, mitochondrial-like n=1 Tax=Acanthaster planci TaxID=133434 RepID=A0A8B7Y023_ACAPL|nr:PRELI domain-containing protein 1, mitochondrial-like [Acanthaster planci]XP_022086504.1 PRELI domain-containing protein 1, mitochondrial-like [Acanthaster planci]
MKYFTTVELFRHTWDHVATALWQKYPNPYSKHVLTEDVISRVLRGTELVTRRLLTKTNRLPRWGNYIFGNHARQVCIVEESIVDPVKKTFTIYTRNIGFTRLMVVTEKLIFRPAPENKDWTHLEKHSWVDSSVKGMALAIQHFGMERYKANQTKATKGLHYVLENMFVPDRPPTEGFPVDMARLRDSAKAKAKGMAAKTRPVIQ